MAGPHTRRSLNQQIRRICNDAAEDYVPEKNEWKLASAQVKAIPADPNDTALREYLEFLLQNASNRWMELGQQSNPNWGLVFHLLLLVLSIGAYGLAIGIENYKVFFASLFMNIVVAAQALSRHAGWSVKEWYRCGCFGRQPYIKS